jgi:hypothetical protein
VRSNSPLAELIAYGRERLAKTRIALLMVFIAGLGFAVEPPGGVSEAVVRVLLIALLVVQFRLWDDIADREHDRTRYPERVLQRHKGRATPFLLAMGLLALPILALLSLLQTPAWRIAAYGLLVAALAVVYGSHATAHGRVMRMGWVLLKYPIFVLLPLTWPPATNAWVAATIAYLMVMLYDWATSPDAADLRGAGATAPWPEMFETVACLACGSPASAPFVNAEDDLTGRPGRFSYVRCRNCRLAYQSPRLKLEHMAAYYEDLAAPGQGVRGWGWLDTLYARMEGRAARCRASILERHAPGGRGRSVLDLVPHGLPLHGRDFGTARFDVITMWDFLQRHYDPLRALQTARELLAADGILVIEVPRLDSRTWQLYHERWPGLKAPRHTVLFTCHALEAILEAAGLEVVRYLPYGSTPAYLYLFAGAAFRVLKGRRGAADRAIVPFVLGQIVLFPILLFEHRLKLASQTVICRRRGSAVAPPSEASPSARSAA